MEDIRKWRNRFHEGFGMHCLYPIWAEETGVIAKRFIDSGYRAIVVCVDTKRRGIEKGQEELKPFLQTAQWQGLRAVAEGRLFYADGISYFNRHGPRLADSAEMMHPELFDFGYKNLAWKNGQKS